MNNIKQLLPAVIILLMLVLPLSALAQVSFSGQILQRAELRHGYGTLADSAVNHGFHIGQRSRVGFNYAHESSFKMHVSVQDVRIWGNTPQIKVSDGFLSVHEAYAQYSFTDWFSIKFGRQELSYDEHRFLGNLDWALQARAHDIALFMFEKEDFNLHIGAAYNQNSAPLLGNFYEIQNQYKTAQMVRAEKQFGDFTLSALFWNNGLQYVEIDEDSIRWESIKYIQTFGLPTIRYKNNNFTATAYYYHQIGKNGQNQTINAFNTSGEVSYLLMLNDTLKRSLRVTAGLDYLSGNSQLPDASEENRAYNPMYGTNHRHNGYIDYFYVGGRHINSVGLQDYYLRLKFDVNNSVFLSLNTHAFFAAGDVSNPETAIPEAMNAFLGTELDFTLGWKLNHGVSVQAGYSHMFASETMEVLRGGRADVPNYWGYLALLFRPEMTNRFTGLKF